MSSDAVFYLAASALAIALLAWIWAVWSGHPYSRRPLFRALPFVLVIILFALAFNSEQPRS